MMPELTSLNFVIIMICYNYIDCNCNRKKIVLLFKSQLTTCNKITKLISGWNCWLAVLILIKSDFDLGCPGGKSTKTLYANLLVNLN